MLRNMFRKTYTKIDTKYRPVSQEGEEPSIPEGLWRKCNKCGGTLIQRKDDHPDTVKDRLRVYHEQTEPLKEYYEKQGKLHIVEGQEEVADTTALTLKALEA